MERIFRRNELRKDTFDLVANEIAAVMDIPADSLSPDTSLAEIGMDSLEAAQLLVSLEEATQIQLDEKRMKRFATVQSFVDLVNRRAMALAPGS
jgi:acyl carrier protein